MAAIEAANGGGGETMERAIYQVTERDERNASRKGQMRDSALAEIETHAKDAGYWKRRRTTFGLAKRDAAALALQGDVEWHRGRGQAVLDRLMGLGYGEERPGAAYNAGYYEGWHASLNGLKDFLATNPNVAGLGDATGKPVTRDEVAA
jgi:hypothetical protein